MGFTRWGAEESYLPHFVPNVNGTYNGSTRVSLEGLEASHQNAPEVRPHQLTVGRGYLLHFLGTFLPREPLQNFFNPCLTFSVKPLMICHRSHVLLLVLAWLPTRTPRLPLTFYTIFVTLPVGLHSNRKEDPGDVVCKEGR